MSNYKLYLRNIGKTESIEFHVRKRWMKLTSICKEIKKCDIAINMEHKNSHTGKVFVVRICVHIPGKRLISVKKEDENIYAALYAVFNAVERKVVNYNHSTYIRPRKYDHNKFANIMC